MGKKLRKTQGMIQMGTPGQTQADAESSVTKQEGATAATSSTATGSNREAEFPAGQAPAPWGREPGFRYFQYACPSGACFREVKRYAADGSKATWYEQYEYQVGWERGLKGITERPLYRGKTLFAAPLDAEIFIPEGPAKVELLTQKLGVLATCNPMGAGKWDKVTDDLPAVFRGKHVVILQDNDAVGRRHAEQVARSLAAIAASVKVVMLPDLPEAGDVVDWYEARSQRGLSNDEIAVEFRHLIAVAPVWSVPAVQPTPTLLPSNDDYPHFVAALQAAGCEPKEDGTKGTARCPCADQHANADRKPSLTYARGHRQPVVARCHAGCSWSEIQKALGLTPDAPPLPPPDSIPLPDFTNTIWTLTIPDDPAYADAALFRLVRYLKEKYDLMADTATMARFVREWCRRAIIKAGDRPEFEPALVWDDFCRKWWKAKWSVFEGPMGDVFRRAEAAPYPPCAARYSNETIRRLVRLCEHLQYQAGDSPWFLTCRQAALMLGMQVMTVSRALRTLVKDGILREAKPKEIPEMLQKRRRLNSKYYLYDPK